MKGGGSSNGANAGTKSDIAGSGKNGLGNGNQATPGDNNGMSGKPDEESGGKKESPTKKPDPNIDEWGNVRGGGSINNGSNNKDGGFIPGTYSPGGLGFVPDGGLPDLPENRTISQGNAILSDRGKFRNGILFGRGEINFLFGEAMLRGEVSGKNGLPDKGMVGAFAKGSVLNASGRIGLGDEHFSISLKGVVDIISGNAQAGLGLKSITSGRNAGISFGGIILSALASVASGRATIEINYEGWQIELGATGYAIGAGAGLDIGYFVDRGGFRAVLDISAAFGAGGLVRVQPPSSWNF